MFPFLLLTLLLSLTAQSHRLEFDASGKFLMAQFADLHYGEDEDGAWGPVQDTRSSAMMRTILSLEHPHMAIFSGDQITGNNVNANATAYLAVILGVVNATGTPWATIYGNHDDAPCCSKRNLTAPLSTTTRQQCTVFEQATFPLLSHTGMGPESLLPAVSVYSRGVYATPTTTTPSLFLFFLDSGGGSYDEKLYSNQTAWLAAESTRLAAAYGRGIPSLVFVHIPPPELSAAYIAPSQKGSPCVGSLDDDGITPTLGKNALVPTTLAMNATTPVVAMFFGHDHGNAWCCPTSNASSSTTHVQMCYGRHSGYGGYGEWARGARMVSAQITPIGLRVASYIRMEDGTTNSAQPLN